MAKSLFAKVLTILIVILAVSFTVTGVLLDVGLHRLIAEQRAEQLHTAGNKVEQVFEEYLRNEYFDRRLFTSFVEAIAENTGSLIWIVRSDDGAFLTYSSIPENVMKNLATAPEGWLKLPDERQYRDDLGRNKYLSGDFYGLFKDSEKEWLTVSISFTIKDIPPHNISFNGTILIHSELPALSNSKYSILRVFLIAGGIGSAIALILVFILSRRLVKPLAEMKRVARRIASGEFKERIEIRGEDEIAELAKSFNNMVDALENLDNMRKDFLSNVSHELRTPITTIKGFVDGILDGVVPEDRQKTYLSIIRDEAGRMQSLVNDLLDLARIQAGEMKLKITSFDINELVRRSVISLQQLLVEKNLEFSADFETERLFVEADPEAIRRVIVNLLHNAVKFTPEGGHITVRTFKDRDVNVIVEDTGCGIRKEELPYVFERFYKADKSRGLDKSGVGLGLAIVRNIIVSHQQSIRVESEEGKGTRFIFTLRASRIPEQY